MRESMLVEEYQETSIIPLPNIPPRPPGESATVISWKPKEWAFLLYCKQWVKDNPDDIPNKLVYRNLLRSYRLD